MHWGDVAQEVLRGKRNGQGTAMLFVTHPNRIAEQITMWPDLLAYPAWLIGLPISLALGAVSWWISVAWTCLLVLPAFRALRSETPGTFLRVKWVRSVSFFGGLISFVLDRRIRVLLVVSGHGVIRTTPSRELLAKCGIPTQGIDATKRCFGMRLLWCRLHGASIVDLRHADLLRDGRSDSHLVRGLRLARRVGIRVVAWDHEGDESAPRDVDTLIVSSRRRQEELVAAPAETGRRWSRSRTTGPPEPEAWATTMRAPTLRPSGPCDVSMSHCLASKFCPTECLTADCRIDELHSSPRRWERVTKHVTRRPVSFESTGKR